MSGLKEAVRDYFKESSVDDFLAGSKLSFFEDDTNNPVQVFADENFTIPFKSQIVADCSGNFPDMFVDNYTKLRAELRDFKGNYLAILTSGNNFGVEERCE